jgi:predicted DCC family thiol-disulfide oxidoreductase YuxK
MSLGSRTELKTFHWLLVRWRQVFFPEGSADELGFHRLLFFGAVFAYSVTVQRDTDLWALVSEVFSQPVFFFSLLHLPIFSGSTLKMLVWLWRVALCLAAVGLFTRMSVWIAFILGFYLLGLVNHLGKPSGNDGFIIVGLAIFAFSRCGDGWSLDNLRRTVLAARGDPVTRRTSTKGEESSSSEYSWPLWLNRLMLTLVLFAAATAKLRTAGFTAWVLSDNLYYILIYHHYTHNPPTNLGLLFARFPWACRLLAGTVVSIEFITPLLLVLSTRWRMLLLAAVVGVMTGFGLMLGVYFIEYIVLLLIFFLPWQELGVKLVRYTAKTALFVLYDGSCGLCQRTVAVIGALDLLNRVRIYEVLADWHKLPECCSGLSQQACLQTMYVVGADGQVFLGFRAYRALAWQLPLGWPFMLFAYVPGVPWIGERVYTAIAARRHATGCPIPAPLTTTAHAAERVDP